MNDIQQTHPSPDELAAFTAGKLNAVECDEIERHLGECEACCQVLNALPDNDTLVALLRDPEADTSVVEEPGSIDETIVPHQQTQQPAGDATESPEKSEAAYKLELPTDLRDHPRYRIVEVLGRGGMGDVYRAEHKVMNRQVALKVIKPELVQNDSAVRRFRREVQAAAQLHHGNIVTAYDAEQAGDLHYLVMEFVDGVDLDEVIRERGALPVDEACEIVRQTADGLQHAHEQGMVHRDIKPHNLMITVAQAASLSASESEQTENRLAACATVKILDFGLANFANETAAEEVEGANPEHHAQAADVLHQLTQMGTMMGTPDYIAPEQAEDAHTADIRSDIYSLGCTFYTLLTGQAPFGEGSVMDKIKAHTEQDAPPLSDFREDVPAEVETILRKMIAKDPDERFQTPAEVAVALISVAASFQLAKPVPKTRQAGSSSPRKRWPRWTKVAAALAGLALLGVTLFIVTDTGTVVINSDTDEVQLVIMDGFGDVKEEIDVKKGKTRIRLRSGDYRIDLRGNTADFYLSQSKVIFMKRGWEVPIRIEARGAPDVPAPPSASPEIASLLTDAVLILSFDQKHFYEPNASTYVRDISMHQHEVRLEKARHSADGQVGGAVEIDGGGLHVEKGLIASGNPYTVAGWIWLDWKNEDKSPSAGVFSNAIGKDGLGFSASVERVDHYWMLLQNVPSQGTQPGEESVRSSWGPFRYEDKGPNLNFAQRRWSFVAFRRDNDGHFWFTANAKSMRLNTKAKANTKMPAEAVIGRGLVGKMDEFVVFDRALSDDEIGALYRHGRAGRSLALPASVGTKAIEITEVRRFIGHEGTVKCVAISPDGKLLASASGWPTGDQSLRLWDIATGKELGRFEGHRGEVVGVAFSADGRQLVSSATDRSARLWDVETRKELARFAGHGGGRVNSVAITPDGRRVITGSAQDRAIRVWDVESGNLVKELEHPPAGTVVLDVSADGKKLLASGGLNKAMLWDLATFQPLHELPVAGQIECVRFSHDGRHAAIATLARSIHLYDVGTGREIRRIEGHRNGIFSVAFTPDDRHLVSCSYDATVRVWEFATGREIARSADVHDVMQTLAVTPEGKHVVTGGGFRSTGPQQFERVAGGELRLWQLPESVWPVEQLTEIRRLEGHTKRPMDLLFLKDGMHAISSGGDGTIRLWNVEQAEVVRQFEDKDSQMSVAGSLALSPDERQLVSHHNTERMIRVWDFATGKVIQRIDASAKDNTFDIDFIPGKNLIVTAAYDGRLRFWNATTGERSGECGPFTGKMDVGPDGRVLMGNQLIEVPSGRVVRTLESHEVKSVAISPDGTLAVTGSTRGRVYLGDLQSGKRLVRWEGTEEETSDDGEVEAITFTPDGRHVISGDRDRTLRVFSVKSLREVARATTKNRVSLELAVSPDGRTVLAGGGEWYDIKAKKWVQENDYAIRLWRLPESVWPKDGAD